MEYAINLAMDNHQLIIAERDYSLGMILNQNMSGLAQFCLLASTIIAKLNTLQK